MHTIRLNNVPISVRGQTVTLLDVFGDLSEVEISNIISYLLEEGFVNSKKELNVVIKSESFLSSKKKKESKKKN